MEVLQAKAPLLSFDNFSPLSQFKRKRIDVFGAVWLLFLGRGENKNENMKHFLKIFIALFSILLSAVAAFGQTPRYPVVEKYFAIGFQQDGKVIPVENQQVILKKKTFTIILYFTQPEGVLVNASFYPKSFEQARMGIPLKDIAGFSDLGMAEEAFNPKTLLMLSSEAPHYWYYHNATDHRFNDVIQQDGKLLCRRIIAQVMYRDNSRRLVPVRDIRENELYLVFMKTEWTNDFSQQIEKQRDVVKIIFR